MSVKCTRDKQNEDSSFSIVVYPACPRATPTAPAPARAGPGDVAGTARPAPPPAPPRRARLRCGSAGSPLQGTAGRAAGPRPGRAPWGIPSAERGGGRRRSASGTRAGCPGRERLLERCDAKIHSQKSSAKNSQLKNTADCEIMFQITKNTVFNKNNLNSFMNPFYFKSLFYCLLMLQFSSSTFY